jgi:hypothetical protein
MLICCSEEAIETFIAHRDIAAGDLLRPYGDVLMVLSTVLRIKRTLDGAEIDDLISGMQARKALATNVRAGRGERGLSRTPLVSWRNNGVGRKVLRSQTEPFFDLWQPTHGRHEPDMLTPLGDVRLRG